MAKYIFVMGGVLSSLGKGIATASIGLLLKSMGYKVVLQKFDPYLNVDPGTMSPFQHGEVFVTDDGAETDLDLGHYERFVDEALSSASSCSAGQIYESVIMNERKGSYLGKTVQVIPHVTNEIKSRITRLSADKDIVITEIGGTVGDIESLPFLEAVRQLRLDLGVQNTLNILLTYVPYIKTAGELKTKPSQHSAYKLREIGIQPDILLCRSEKTFDDEIYSKIALFTNVPKESVINAIDVKCVYEIPLIYQKANLPAIICRHFKMDNSEMDLSQWQQFLTNRQNSDGEVSIAVCGKYVKHHDAYKSVVEALMHAAAKQKKKLNIKWVDSERSFKAEDLDSELKDIDGILIPGGFGIRGIEGKINIAHYARSKNIPLLGICLGMQVMAIEYARNVCKLNDANSTEFDEITGNPVIHLMEDQRYIDYVGGSMRLGAYTCKLCPDSLAHRSYGSLQISERHRHRYEFNNEYREKLCEAGLRLSGLSENELLVEILEYPANRFHIGVQFHPEFKSRPNRPHPLFIELIKAAVKA
ncbi:MAG: CTP synthase [Candidatus Cloacimonadales bacterium]|nr:CTP synthase [Candidatus Cloacimonadota bacterium]MDY0380644.1 CTP synthase [Candidatus Cloacimonadaceae bacterium]MCB5263400.1 CTP synthase [Candidatus Cloacimonadota bacterium]MCB5276404.1 CTP synthase [Candidatus Cloacimonadota bacterium]MCK9433306.1 CTP synthase [Candidatus Cloacimonadota bacterium]